MKRVFIGIDGGGTKTSVSALDEEGRIILSEAFGPSNFLNGNEFENTMLAVFRELFSVLKTVYRNKVSLNIISGFAGISSGDCENRFHEVFKKAALGYDVKLDKFALVSDALLALNVYFDKKPGLLLISGTGSICYGKGADGKIFRTGGYGYLIDDAGSGFWFGKEAIKAALTSSYVPGQKTVLEELVINHYGVKDTDDLFTKIYRSDSRSVIASASELVFAAAEQGCPIAEDIIERGAGELIKLVRSCSELIDNLSPCVVLHGSVFIQEKIVELIRNDLKEDLNVYLSDKRIDLEAANLILDQKEP